MSGPDAEKPASIERRRTKRKPSDTLGERVERFRRTALFESGKHFSQVKLSAPFDELHAAQIYPAAEAFKRKDGTGIGVAVEHEIELQPGVVIWVRYFHPKIDASVRVEGENVVEFPKLKEFQEVTIRAIKIWSDQKADTWSSRRANLLFDQ